MGKYEKPTPAERNVSFRKGYKYISRALRSRHLNSWIAACAIEESFIAHRLLTYCRMQTRNEVRVRLDANENVGITYAMQSIKSKLKSYSCSVNKGTSAVIETQDLYTELDNWIQKRNPVIHCFIKIDPMNSRRNFEDYRLLARETAKEGFRILRLVDKWYNEQKKQFKSSPSKAA